MKGEIPVLSERFQGGRSQVNDSDRICFQPTQLEGIDLRAGYYRVPGGFSIWGSGVPFGGVGWSEGEQDL